MTNEQNALLFGGVTPIFRVQDLAASIDYYVNILEFQLDWQAPAILASVTRDKCNLFLCEGDQGHAGGWVFISVPDAHAAHEHFKSKGATIRHPPTNYEWSLEMQLEDLDGNVLRLGSDPKNDEPFGEWLDMNGVRWAPSGGGWKEIE